MHRYAIILGVVSGAVQICMLTLLLCGPKVVQATVAAVH